MMDKVQQQGMREMESQVTGLQAPQSQSLELFQQEMRVLDPVQSRPEAGGVEGRQSSTDPAESLDSTMQSVYSRFSSHMDDPYREIYTFLTEHSNSGTITSADMLLATAKINQLSIVTQAQMNIVKKTDSNLNRFLSNQ